MRTFLRLFTKSLQFKYYFSPYFASAGFKEEMGAQKARPAAKKAPGVRAVPVKQKKLKVPIFGESGSVANRNRTGTKITLRQILSLQCLPVPP